MTIKALDGIRGLAVLLVLLSHMSLEGIHLYNGVDFSGFGKVGVYLFFCLSAFLLTLQAFEAGEAALASKHYWAGYLLRRFCRIYPLYVLVLISSLILTQHLPGYSPSILSVVELLEHLLLLKGNSIFWAIPVEFKYYLALPVVAILLFHAARVHLILASACLLAMVSAALYIWPPASAAGNSIALGQYVTLFFIGSFAALAHHRYAEAIARHNRMADIAGSLALLSVAATVPALWRLVIDSDAGNQVFHQAFVFYGVVWSVAIVAALNPKAYYTRFFEWRACRFVGRISFSAYLWHFPILKWVSQHADAHTSLKFILAMSLTLVASYASYRFLERPFISWGHRFTRNWGMTGKTGD